MADPPKLAESHFGGDYPGVLDEHNNINANE